MPHWDADRLDPDRYPGPGIDLPVLFADLDVNGHLNNVAMGRFFEHARATAFAGQGFWKAAHVDGGRSFVVRVCIDYLREVQAGATMHVRSRFVAIGRSSARVEQAAWVDGTPVGLAEVVFAHAMNGSGAPWPPEAVQILEQLIEQSKALG
ncbi:MAG TPA: acyl-CoA thioesterase [Mycobacteriales bacterium]|nr:acyl-CoA thioesterase [Mycobacteriales bacterium]